MLEILKEQLAETQEELRDLYRQRRNASPEAVGGIKNKIQQLKKEIVTFQQEIAEEEKKQACKAIKTQVEKTVPAKVATETPAKLTKAEELQQSITVFQQKVKELNYATSKEDIAEMLSIRNQINDEIFKDFDEQLKFVTAKKELMYALPEFDVIYTSKKLSKATKQDIDNIRNDKESYQYYDRCVIVSVLTLSLLNFKFDVTKANLLLDFVSDFEDEVWQRALTGLMIVLMSQNRSWLRAKAFVNRLQTLQKNDEVQDAIRMIEFILYNKLYKMNLIVEELFELDLFKNTMYYFLPFYENNEILNDALDNTESDIDTDEFQKIIEGMPLLSSFKYRLCMALKENNIKFRTNEVEEKDNLKQISFSIQLDFQPFQNLITEYFCFFKFFPAQKAKDIFKKQLTLSNNTKLKKIVLNRINALLIEANTAFEDEKYKAATTKYEEILAINKTHKETKEKLAKCYAIIGSNYNGKKDYDKAIEYYQKAIAIKPDLHEAFNDIGVAYVKKKEYDKAIEHFQKAIDIKPDDYETFHNMGNTYVHKKDYDKAIKHYQQAIAIKPDYHRAYNSWGLTLLKMNKIEEGKEKLEKSIALGNLSHGNANLGHIFLIEQKETAALQHYRKSLAAFEDKNKFWELMKEDFEGLNLEQYGISAAYYEEVLGKIKL